MRRFAPTSRCAHSVAERRALVVCPGIARIRTGPDSLTAIRICSDAHRPLRDREVTSVEPTSIALVLVRFDGSLGELAPTGQDVFGRVHLTKSIGYRSLRHLEIGEGQQ